MKTMVDNVATLAVEATLVKGLDEIFSPLVVAELDQKTISILAAESAENLAQREQLSRQAAALTAGWEILQSQMKDGLQCESKCPF